MPVTGVARFGRFFRAAAGLDVDKDDLRRYSDVVNHCDDDGGGCGEGLTQSTTGLVPIA
jgi:hypothetical protein